MAKSKKTIITPTEKKLLLPGDGNVAPEIGSYDEKIGRLRSLVKQHEKRNQAVHKELIQCYRKLETLYLELLAKTSSRQPDSKSSSEKGEVPR